MKNGYIFKKNLLRFFFLTLASCFMVACNDDDDTTDLLDNRTSLVLTPSDYEIELKEDTLLDDVDVFTEELVMRDSNTLEPEEGGEELLVVLGSE